MSETAMRDADGTPVFVREDGSYSYTFPEEEIVESSSDSGKFVVYGFVGSHGDFEEVEWEFTVKEEALSHATEIYGEEDVQGFTRDGEVFQVEVHQR